MIGVLALQGGFIEHIHALERLGVKAVEIRRPIDLESRRLDGLIVPGGESTVIAKLLLECRLFAPLKSLIESGTPVLGTCAGLILLAKKTSDDAPVCLGCIDIEAKRNAFGRQLGSFLTEGHFDGIGQIPMAFIRAPYIESVSSGVEVLARVRGHIVAARKRNVLVTAFHPELTDDLRLHQYFLKQMSG